MWSGLLELRLVNLDGAHLMLVLIHQLLRRKVLVESLEVILRIGCGDKKQEARVEVSKLVAGEWRHACVASAFI